MDVAANLRELELASIRVQRDNGLRSSVLKSLDERGGAQELVRQQYSGRYPFELLQNANDAALGAGVQGRTSFLLTETALIVADNGYGFGEKQVEAICSLGRSSKDPGTSIGHKGLGFKSVGEITDRPQIISPQTSFQFDGERVRQEALTLLGSLPDRQKFPVYAFPFSVEGDDLGADAAEVKRLRDSGWTTVIRLPLRKDVEKSAVEDHLIGCLLPRLLLFLHGVDHLELRGTRADFSVEVSRDDDEGAERVLLEVDKRVEEWLIYRGEVTPDLALLEPMGGAWTEMGNAHIAVAVPLDDSSKPRTDEQFPLNVYFPTEEHPGTHLAVHAEWALSMDRRQLAATPEATPYNQFLLEQTTQFIASTVAVDLARRTGASLQSVLALVPTVQAPTSGAGSRFRQLWCKALSNTPFLPAAAGTMQLPAEIRLLPPKLPSLTEAHALANLDGHHTLRPDVEEQEPIRAFLITASLGREMGLGEFLAQLRPPTPATSGAHYAFLMSWRNTIGQPLVAQLTRVPSVLARNGVMLTPATETVFLPRTRGDSAIPDNIPVPIAEVPEVEGVETFLRELGVKSFEWRELIREFLIKILTNPGADPVDRAQAMDGLRAYHNVRLSGSEDLAPLLSRVLLPAQSYDGSAQGLREGGSLYFNSTWTGSDELEVIYGPFGKLDFLDEVAPEGSDEREREFDFYRMLGVADHPRLDEARPSERQGFMVGGPKHPHRGPLFREWEGQPDVADAARCPQGHPSSQQLKLSIRLDRQLDIAESNDPLRLLAFWKQLARRWGTIYEPAMESVFHCVHGSHSGERDRRCASLFAYTLRSRRWVPVDRGAAPDVVRPEEAWIDTQETPRRIKERIPRISEDMYKMHGGAAMSSALSLTDAGRPKVDDLLVLLRSVADEADGTLIITREIELAARYIQRTLNDVLPDSAEPHPQPERVRLLASFCGRTAFVAQPPFADDPLLRDTWEQQRPLLAAETGLGRLTRYLSLTKLDDAVTTSAKPYGEHAQDSIFEAVRRKINGTKPYILALIRAENPRAEGSARAALKRLELVVCDQLVLQYRYEGVDVEREDAVCYIAVRQDKSGRRTRNVGTAYLELDPRTDQPHWFQLGRQLAQHVGTPGLADAVTMLITASKEDRDRMMADRHIRSADISEAREQLRLAAGDEEELGNVLDSLLPAIEPSGQLTPLPQSSQGATTSLVEEPEISEHGGGASPGTPNVKPKPQPSLVPPPLDHDAVRISDARPGSLEPTVLTSFRTGGMSGTGTSSAPSIQNVEENYRVGKRGEEAAYYAERRRLRDLNKNPDLVIWVSKTDELAPFDIKSIDEDDQVIYIEVKSTKGSDPSDPFYISHAELLEAIFYRDRYYIYRVTKVDSAAPEITRASDPLLRIKEGKGRLLLAKAHMALAMDRHLDSSTN